MNTPDDKAPPLPHIIASAPLLDHWWVDDAGRIRGRVNGVTADLPLTDIDVHGSWSSTPRGVFRLGRCAEGVATHSLRRAAHALRNGGES